MCRSGSPGVRGRSGSICKRIRGSLGSTGSLRLPAAPTRFTWAASPPGQRNPVRYAFSPTGRHTSAARSFERANPGGPAGVACAQAATASQGRARTPRSLSGVVLLEIPAELAAGHAAVGGEHRLVFAAALRAGERLHLDGLGGDPAEVHLQVG